METYTAWQLIGFAGNLNTVPGDEPGPDRVASVRTVGGRTLYGAVDFDDSRPGLRVRLSRVEVGPAGLRQVDRWVDPDVELELVEG